MGKTRIELKEYLVFTPYLGGYFICYGIINSFTYYCLFNISIFDYISFTEIIFYFIKNVHYICISVIIGIGMYLLLMKVENELLNFKHKKQKRDNQNNSESKLNENSVKEVASIQKGKKQGKIFGYLDFFGAIIFIIVVLLMILFWKRLLEYIYIFTALSTVILTLSFYFVKDLRLRPIIFCIIMITMFSVSTAADQSIIVLKGMNTGIKMTIDKRLYSSANNCYLIGNTEKYIFIFNKKEHKSMVFPHEKIDSVEIPLK